MSLQVVQSAPIATTATEEYAIFLLMDGSGSVKAHFSDIKNISTYFARSFIGMNAKFGIIVYSNTSTIISELTNDLKGVETLIQNMNAPFHSTHIAPALAIAYDRLVTNYNYPEDKICKRIVIAVTDGHLHDKNESKYYFDALQANGVLTVTVGVTEQIDKYCLRESASPQMFYEYKDFSELRNNVGTLVSNITSKYVDMDISFSYTHSVEIGSGVALQLKVRNTSLSQLNGPIVFQFHENDYFASSTVEHSADLSVGGVLTLNFTLQPKPEMSFMQLSKSDKVYFTAKANGNVPVATNINSLHLPARIFNFVSNAPTYDEFNVLTIGKIGSGKSKLGCRISEFMLRNNDINPFDCGSMDGKSFTTELDNFNIRNAFSGLGFDLNLLDMWGWDIACSTHEIIAKIYMIHREAMTSGCTNQSFEMLTNSFTAQNNNSEYLDAIILTMKAKDFDNSNEVLRIHTIAESLERLKIHFLVVVTHIDEVTQDPSEYFDESPNRINILQKLTAELQKNTFFINLEEPEGNSKTARKFQQELTIASILKRLSTIKKECARKERRMNYTKNENEKFWFSYEGKKLRASIATENLIEILKYKFDIHPNDIISICDDIHNISITDIPYSQSGTKERPFNLKLKN